MVSCDSLCCCRNCFGGFLSGKYSLMKVYTFFFFLRQWLLHPYRLHYIVNRIFPVASGTLPANAGGVSDAGLVPGSGRPRGGGNSNPLLYSCLENPMNQRSLAGWGCKESDTTEATQVESLSKASNPHETRGHFSEREFLSSFIFMTLLQLTCSDNLVWV